MKDIYSKITFDFEEDRSARIGLNFEGACATWEGPFVNLGLAFPFREQYLTLIVAMEN